MTAAKMALDYEDSSLSPTAFTAIILNLYVSPVVKVEGVVKRRAVKSNEPFALMSSKVVLKPP